MLDSLTYLDLTYIDTSLNIQEAQYNTYPSIGWLSVYPVTGTAPLDMAPEAAPPTGPARVSQTANRPGPPVP